MATEIASNNTEHLILKEIEQYLKKEKDDTIFRKNNSNTNYQIYHTLLYGRRRNIHKTKARFIELQRYHRISSTLRLTNGPKNI